MSATTIATITIYFAGGFGLFALVVSATILARPTLGPRFFGDWSSAKLNAMRVAVTAMMLAGAWTTGSPLMLAASCVLTAATLLFGVMSLWRRGHDFVQAKLVESERGARLYVVCVIMPMATLLIASALLA